ncbi:rCG35678, partial [Rattus norvegicus]
EAKSRSPDLQIIPHQLSSGQGLGVSFGDRARTWCWR